MEHRWSVRKPQCCPVVVDTPRHGRIGAKSHDIGIGGMFIETDDITLPLNTPVNVAFTLPREPYREDFRLPAMVVRHAPTGAGVMFLDIEIDTLRALRRALYDPLNSERELEVAASSIADAEMVRLPRAVNS
jgi:PilZ domain